MKNQTFVAIATFTAMQILASTVHASPAVDSLLEGYRQQGASQFNAKAGQQLWNQSFSNNKGGQPRSCTSCHTDNPGDMGKHAKTGKAIKPMAPSVNAKRLSDEKHMRKWFKRNCKWTMGRECSAQEQGDVLMYLKDM